MDNNKIAETLAKIILNERNVSDENLDSWLAENTTSKRVLDELSSEEILSRDLREFYRKDKFENNRRLLKAIYQKRKNRIISKITSVAAVLLIGIFCYTYFDFSRELEVDHLANQLTEITSISSLPTISLASGEKIVVTNELKSKELKSIIPIVKSKNSTSKIGYNKIVVPRGTTYNFSLPDGTKVTLNSESELVFSTHFNLSERCVKLKGEAYFDVSHNETPFIVNVEALKIKVYGTKFNINSYDPNQVKTFLSQGKVGLTYADVHELFLAPSHVAITDMQNGITEIKVASSDDYLAWTNGYFMYNNEDLESILQNLAKFYDVEFIFQQNELKKLRTVASFDQSMSIVRILRMLEKAVDVKFYQQERRFYVEKQYE